MSSYPYISLFSSTLFISTIMALSSSHWLMIWMALELNMLSFIPLIIFSSNHQETESAVKYFMAQALGSSLLLLGAITISQLSSLMFLGLAIKAGMAPFHFWFPLVMSTSNWAICLLITTWQKLIPLLLMMFLFSNTFPLLSLTLGTLSAIVGGVGGLNQTQLRPLIAYSSIGHMGWMIVASEMSPLVAFIYFATYITISIPLFAAAWNNNTFSLKFSSQIFLLSPSLIFMLIILLSLGGMPPLLGFFPKWALLLKISSPLVALILIMGSLMNLFYYLNIIFSIFMTQNTQLLNRNQQTSMHLPLLTVVATLPLPLMAMN